MGTTETETGTNPASSVTSSPTSAPTPAPSPSPLSPTVVDQLYSLAAEAIERVFGNYVTTILGVSGIVISVLGACTTLLHQPYAQWAEVGGAVLAGVTAALAKDSGTKLSNR